MKLIIIIFFSVLYINCLGQTTFGSIPSQPKSLDTNNYSTNINVGLTIFPYQKIEFLLNVNTKNHEVNIIDDKGKLLFNQSFGKGYFNLITGKKYKYLIIYDKILGKHITVTKESGDFFNSQIVFGKSAAEVKIITSLIPGHIDTVKKQFVRFLVIDAPLNVSNFSISLKKIENPTILTEPLIMQASISEKNILVDKYVYEKFKKYVLGKAAFFKNDTIGFGFQPMLEVSIDYKHRYYFKVDNAKLFLTNFEAYISRNKQLIIFLNQLNIMIEDLEYAESRDKNEDPN